MAGRGLSLFGSFIGSNQFHGQFQLVCLFPNFGDKSSLWNVANCCPTYRTNIHIKAPKYFSKEREKEERKKKGKESAGHIRSQIRM
jgi:hypothetical protein